MYKDALRRQAAALASTQGEDTRRWDLTFDEQRDQNNETRKYNRDKLEQDYRIAKMNARTAEERNAIDRWKAEKDYELGQADADIKRGAQGLDLLKTDVDLRSSVANWAKLADWEAGVAQNDQAPAFLRSLLQNAGVSTGTGAPQMTAPGGLPQQNSLASTLASMGQPTGATANNAATGAGANADKDPRTVAIQAIAKNYTPSQTEGWGPKDVASLRAIAALAAQGEGKYANSFAQMDEDDQQFILGGMARLGRNPERVARNLDRWRVSNTASGAAA